MQNILSKKLEDNIKFFDEKFSDSPDIKKQKFLLRDESPALLVYVEGLVDKEMLQRDILAYAMQLDSKSIYDDSMQITHIPTVDSSITEDLDVLVNDILNGKAAIIFNGYNRALSINLIKFEKRNVSEPTAEKNVKGPQEAFIESLNTNISILRRKIKNPKLKFKTATVGTVTHQNVALAYIEDLANPENINIVYEKIKAIDYDGVFDVSYLEQLLTDNPTTPFPHYIASERPDKTVSCLQEGKLAVLLDGSPFALLMPMTFFAAFQAPDDYNANWLVGSLNRLVRIFAMLIAMFLPALYVAIVSYHYYMVPLNLLVPLAESRAKVPFPPVIEVLILEYTIEMLREATIRLPTYIGTSIGIVGGLIIGQAAVDAGIVSNLIIIIVAVTALASYLIPNYDMGLTVRYIRFIVMFFASIFGLIGVVITGLFIISHLVVLESLGEPYFKPMLPFRANDFKDIILRPSLKSLKKRPTIGKPMDKTRGKNNG
jgi:hypothetical protein